MEEKGTTSHEMQAKVEKEMATTAFVGSLFFFNFTDLLLICV